MLSITDEEFTKIRNILYEKAGVNLGDKKKPLILSRLRKRLEELGKDNFTEYIPLITVTNGPEMEFFINAVTTNETFFFRHAAQFNYFYEEILPFLVKKGIPKIHLWCGASSTGEEPYSIGIAFKEFFKGNTNKFSIIASDINTQVIRLAKEGIYEKRSLKDVPDTLKKKYFKEVKIEGKSQELFEVNDDIKQLIEFKQHNLKSPFSEKNLDIVFLRNVLIYFDRDTKQEVINFIEETLKPNGYLFISLSENLNDISTSLKLIKSGIFQKIVQ